jgi:alkylation response protein AidB-like acyl-CoA dehydrogenase
MYTGAMADSDTRPVTFENLVLQSFQSIPSTDEGEALGLHALTRVVFAVMAMAPYLGGAKRALDEACDFLKRVNVDGKPLAELDGYIADLGRANIQYTVCEGLIERFMHSVSDISQDNLTKWIEEEMPKALALKHHVTAVC